jgi:hypothetical protein
MQVKIPPIGSETTPRERGGTDCYQDRCENIPFASVGGLEARTAMRRPKWITEEDEAEYLAGYREMAESLYGADWQTCSFGWTPALELPNREAEQQVLNLIAGGCTPEGAARRAGLMLGTVETIIAHDLERRRA